MEILDTVEGKEPGAAQTPDQESHVSVSIDRFEATRRFEEREEEEKAEAAMALYARAARQRMQPGALDETDNAASEEEREARSYRLKLQQKCQDIAALILVDELEDEEE